MVQGSEPAASASRVAGQPDGHALRRPAVGEESDTADRFCGPSFEAGQDRDGLPAGQVCQLQVRIPPSAEHLGLAAMLELGTCGILKKFSITKNYMFCIFYQVNLTRGRLFK